MSRSLLPTDENPHPLLSLEGEEKKRFIVKSLTITAVMTAVIYLVPGYYWLEVLTTQTSYFFLQLFSFSPRLYIYESSLSELSIIDKVFYTLYDTNRATFPAISIDNGSLRRQNYLIIRACTGMQAGALLLGLIWSTPATTHDRIRASYTILVALFFGNILRIAAMIALTTIFMENFGLPSDIAWYYAHDWLGRPLGFFGTIGFTVLIESRNVRILDTISLWVDPVIEKINKGLDFIFGETSKSE